MASKSKSRRRVFRASCILAALIVAGSSFAWFTSKDEVTNRLSASGDYDVTIAEDFTPPENWLPGQKVDKNVGAVNTGTIDAFVRMWLEGEMTVLNEKRDTQKWDDANNQFTDGATSPKVTLKAADIYTKGDTPDKDTIKTNDAAVAATITKETDQDLLDKNLTYYYMDDTSKDSKISLKELDSTNIYNNPNSPITEVSSPDGYSEVMALQAGGELVYVKTTDGKFTFTFAPNQTQNIVSAGVTGANPVGGKRYDILGGKTYTVNVDNDLITNVGDDIEVDNTEGAETINVKDLDTFYKYLGDHIDTNSFQPCTTGLYIFKRNADLEADKYADNEYTGYYYVSSTRENEATPANAYVGKYFALQYENDGTSTRSDYVLDKDTYTVTRDETGKETFNPYSNPYKKNDETLYKVGDDYYNADGELVYYKEGTGYKSASSGDAVDVSVYAPDEDNAKSVTLYTAQKKVIENDELKWTYTLNDGTTAPAVGTVVTYSGNSYTYKTVGSVTGWYNTSDEQITAEATVSALNAAASKNNLEVEDNGVVYTYNATTDTWTAADGSTVTDDIKARLNAAVTKKATLTATYYGAENAGVIDGTKDPSVAATDSKYQDPSDDISVVVNLNNINATEAEAWTAILNSQSREATTDGSSDAWGAKDSNQVTFYYNNDVEEGATTRKLVDSVELSSATQKNAYLGFDFDLNVNMESKQITIDDNGKEAFETVNNASWGSTGVMGDVSGAHNGTQSGTEIDKITWTEYPTT